MPAVLSVVLVLSSKLMCLNLMLFLNTACSLFMLSYSFHAVLKVLALVSKSSFAALLGFILNCWFPVQHIFRS